MLSRAIASSNDTDLFWTVNTWLVAPQDGKEFTPLRTLMDSHTPLFPDSMRLLCELRSGQASGEFLRSATRPPMLELQPNEEDWYVLAMAWLKRGDYPQAQLAYEAGTCLSRGATSPWNWSATVVRETLRREVEALLGSENAVGKRPQPITSTGKLSGPGVPTAGEPRDSTASAALK
jgi:hypothetical protein